MLIPVELKNIATAIHQAGGVAFLTGGAVRDFLIAGSDSFVPKDFDVEIHKLDLNIVRQILSGFGEINEVGESFGVIKLKVGAIEFDFSLPRKEKKANVKLNVPIEEVMAAWKGFRVGGSAVNEHKNVDVEVAPHLDVDKAAARRDFTINAAMLNIVTGELVDPFNARADIAAKVLRHTSDAFVEDPLRPLRAMQFAGRFGFTVAPETAELCKAMRGMAAGISVERVWEEWSKWATKSTLPSFGLRALVDMGWEVFFPELAALNGLAQEFEFHPEGCALTHTGLACDAAVEIAARDALTGDDKRIAVFGALCHDFGKATTTELAANGRITSRGHDRAGEAPTISFLNSIGAPNAIVNAVVPLVVGHMFHVGAELNDSNVRRLANRLAPHTTIEMLMRIIEADHSARLPLPKGNPCPELMEIAERLSIQASKPKPILGGKHLIELGVKPGKIMGDILKDAFELQLAGHIMDEQQAVDWARSHVATLQ